MHLGKDPVAALEGRLLAVISHPPRGPRRLGLPQPGPLTFPFTSQRLLRAGLVGLGSFAPAAAFPLMEGKFRNGKAERAKGEAGDLLQGQVPWL